jgi:hypothetical protein
MSDEAIKLYFKRIYGDNVKFRFAHHENRTWREVITSDLIYPGSTVYDPIDIEDIQINYTLEWDGDILFYGYGPKSNTVVIASKGILNIKFDGKGGDK